MNLDEINEQIDPQHNYFDSFESSLGSEYISVDEFNASCRDDRVGINIISYNIRSYSANHESLFSMFHSPDSYPEILSLCETWFRKGSERDINGYNAYHVTRENNIRSGGVSVYVRDNFNSRKVEELSMVSETIEICTVEVLHGGLLKYILSIYRPHSDSVESFIDVLDTILNNNILRFETCILLGDININLLSDNTSVNNFMFSMQSLHFIPLVTKPTRYPPVASQSPTLLDHVWINDINLIYACKILSIDFTDHFPIFLKIVSSPSEFRNSQEKIQIKFRYINDHNKSIFEEAVRCFDWSLIRSDDINIYCSKFTETLNSIYCRCFPVKIKYISKNSFEKPWLSRPLKKLISAKSNYFRLYQLNLVTREENNRYKNRIKTLIRETKKKFITSYFRTNVNNMRNTWTMIKTIANLSSNKIKIKPIFWNGQEYNTDEQIAEAFNHYFHSVPNFLSENLPISNVDPMFYVRRGQVSSFFLDPVGEAECLKVVKNLKNTKELVDHIPVFLFKECSVFLIHELCNLINASFRLGIFPNVLKIAKIVPIFKKGERTNIENYRPISILPFLSKVIEKCFCTRLVKFLMQNNILSDSQFGFRSGLTTTDAISNLVEYLYETLNERLTALNVFIDFTRAFDTIDRGILIRKLEAYGIRGIALEFVSDYFRNRMQFVQINNSSSSYKTTKLGIGQGTILGPLFFIIYINDLPNISEYFKTILYADDSTLTFKGKNRSELVSTCNTELEKLHEWTKANRLSLNTDKTFYSLVSNNRFDLNFEVNISIGGKAIERKDKIMFLGVLLDENLKFNHHLSYVCSKVSKSIGILYKLKKHVPPSTLRSLYFAFVYPYLLYSNLVWGSTYITHSQSLTILQKKVIRIINDVHYLHSTNDLFINNRILKLKDINVFTLAIFMFKNRNLEAFRSNNPYNTRTRNLPRSTFQRLSLTQHSVYYKGPIVWNSLPVLIREASNLNQFKTLVRNHLIDGYAQNSLTA